MLEVVHSSSGPKGLLNYFLSNSNRFQLNLIEIIIIERKFRFVEIARGRRTRIYVNEATFKGNEKNVSDTGPFWPLV